MLGLALWIWTALPEEHAIRNGAILREELRLCKELSAVRIGRQHQRALTANDARRQIGHDDLAVARRNARRDGFEASGCVRPLSELAEQRVDLKGGHAHADDRPGSIDKVRDDASAAIRGRDWHTRARLEQVSDIACVSQRMEAELRPRDPEET